MIMYALYVIPVLNLLVSSLILREFKIANAKNPCTCNERVLKNLIDKIDKVIKPITLTND